MQYHVVFDTAEAGYRYWWFPAAGFGMATLVWVMTSLNEKLNAQWRLSKPKRSLPLALPIGFCLLWSIVTFSITFSDYWRLRSALQSGNYTTVEGSIADFVPQAEGDHQPESFDVNGQHFSYSFASVTAGFNQTHTHSGPIHEGMNVRLAVVGDEIARVEAAD